MAKTLEQARQELIAAGYQGEPTPAILRQYGWEPSDDCQRALALQMDPPAQTSEQVKDDVALLYDEAKRNNVPAQILNGIAKVGGIALGLMK